MFKFTLKGDRGICKLAPRSVRINLGYLASKIRKWKRNNQEHNDNYKLIHIENILAVNFKMLVSKKHKYLQN